MSNKLPILVKHIANYDQISSVLLPSVIKIAVIKD